MIYDKKYTIYAIRNKINKKMYIGKTESLEQRLKSHIYALRSGKHNCRLLNEEFEKYGEDNFEFYVLEENIPYIGRSKEYEYMKKYNTFDKKYGYNQGDKRHKNKLKISLIYGLPED